MLVIVTTLHQTCPTLGRWLRDVPLARKSPRYYASLFASGEFSSSAASKDWPCCCPVNRVLELSAGSEASWSCAVAQDADISGVVATDLTVPVVEAAGDGRGVRLGHRDGADADLHAVDAGAAVDLNGSGLPLTMPRSSAAPAMHIQ